jgi:hypothetical protein
MTRRKQVRVVVANNAVIETKRQAYQERQKNKNRELTRLGTALRYLGALGGGAVGSSLGYREAGAALGAGMGAAVSKWAGSGDYRVVSNTVLRGSAGVPMMHKSDQTITVRHREFVSTISGSSNFQVQGTYPLNPGLRGTMPWASGIAAQFQEYKIKGLVWHYVPTSGTFTGGTTALGAIMMQTVYRATDADPTSKFELLNEYWSNEALPCDTMVHPIECAPGQTVLPRRYVRTGSVTDDLMFYDYGRTIVATQGMPNTGIVGDLYITYEIEFSKPKLSIALGDQISSCIFTGTGTSQFSILNAQNIINTYNGLPKFEQLATGPGDARWRIEIPAGNPGTHCVLIESSGSGFASGTPSLTALANSEFVSNFIENSVTTPTSAVTPIRQMYNFAFRVLDPTRATAVALNVPYAFGTGSGGTGLCLITQLDPEITRI